MVSAWVLDQTAGSLTVTTSCLEEQDVVPHRAKYENKEQAYKSVRGYGQLIKVIK